MMTFTLFDVGHGFCAYAEGPNGTNTLFDCGHDDPWFRPSVYFPGRGVNVINRMVLGNFDRDHVSDLQNLADKVFIQHFIRNRSLTTEQLRQLKLQAGPLSSGMQAALKLHTDAVHPNAAIDYAGVELTTFHNPYPIFTDTNNLSLVSFLQYGGSCICIPGDLETAGWKELLKKPLFCAYLALVDIFIASHHGRTSGYCKEVFEYCSPALVLISDKEIVHDTQETDYTNHARGIVWNDSATEKRYVLTTRCDGHMVITKEPSQGFFITASNRALSAKAG
jgi:beta-lactamase superfamily II metal-dependent hydrolase